MPSTISRIKDTDSLPQWAQKINGLITVLESFLGVSGSISINSGSTAESKQLCLFDTTWSNYTSIGDIIISSITSSSTPTATFTLQNSAITGKPELTSIDSAADYLLIYDGNASLLKKISASNFLNNVFSVGGVVNSVQYASSISPAVLGGDSSFLYNPSTKVLSVGGGLIINTNAFFINPSSKYIGIGTTSPSYLLDVSGDINLSSNLRIGGLVVLNGTTLGNNIVNSNLTSLGTITSLVAVNASITNTLTLNILNCSGVPSISTNTGQIKSGPQGNSTIIGDIVDISSSGNVSVGLGYLVMANSITLTLPVSSGLIDGDRISFIPNSTSIINYTIARNSSNIMGSSTDLLVDMYAPFDLVWDATDSTWVLG